MATAYEDGYTQGSLVRITRRCAFAEGIRCIVTQDDGDGEPGLTAVDCDSEQEFVDDAYFEVIDKYPDKEQPGGRFKTGDLVRFKYKTMFYDMDGTYEVRSPTDCDGDVTLWEKDRTDWHHIRATGLLPVTTNEDKTMQDTNPISNPVAALRDSDLDADTAILRKYEFEGRDCSRTSRANEALCDQLWKERRSEFAARLRELEQPKADDTVATI